MVGPLGTDTELKPKYLRFADLTAGVKSNTRLGSLLDHEGYELVQVTGFLPNPADRTSNLLNPYNSGYKRSGQATGVN